MGVSNVAAPNEYVLIFLPPVTVVLQKLFKDRALLSISARYAATPKI